MLPSFQTPVMMLLAGALSLSAIALWTFRGRPRWGAFALLMLGTICITIAAGSPTRREDQKPRIAVMIDESASMRRATYWNKTQRMQRIESLLPMPLNRVSIDTYAFASRRRVAFPNVSIEDINQIGTVFEPPEDVDAIVLFSDGRFDAPKDSPPVFAVIDPAMEEAKDGAIVAMTHDGGRFQAVVRNDDVPRMLMTSKRPATTVPTGSSVIDLGTQGAGEVWAMLSVSPGDYWIENNRLTLRTAPQEQLERWWVTWSTVPAPDGWRKMTPFQLSDRPGDYLSASVVVLDNVPAEHLGGGDLPALQRYVSQLGGSLIIVGGDQAFAAGGYGGTPLGTLSPLASDPPTPQRNWVLLADSSGSMSASINGQSRSELAAGAVMDALAAVPQNDRVSVGDFARNVRWWSQQKSAKATRAIAKLVPEFNPQGPTNLQAAIAAVGDSPDPTELLLVTDGQTQIDDVKSVADALVRRKIRVHMLALAAVDEANVVVQLVRMTGGTLLVEADTAQWDDAAQKLARGIAPTLLVRDASEVSYDAPLALPTRTVALRNSVWPQEGATRLAKLNDGSVVAAQWKAGTGNVAAFAFKANTDEVEAIAHAIERGPRDPRFKVTWDVGAESRVTVDATDSGKPMNDLSIDIELAAETGGSGRVVPLTQTAPGRYTATARPGYSPEIATVRTAGSIIDRRAIAGRYAKEFERIGNDRAALRALADRTGGRLIEPADLSPITLPRRTRVVPLTSQFSLAGATMLVLGLIVQRRGSVR